LNTNFDVSDTLLFWFLHEQVSTFESSISKQNAAIPWRGRP